MRNINILIATLTLLLLFSMTYSTECMEIVPTLTQKESPTSSSVSKNRSILYSPTEEEKQDSTVIGLKQMIKEQKIAEEDVLYLVVHCEYFSIEFVDKDKKSYPIEDVQYILNLLNSEANSKKHIWIIATNNAPKKIKDILKNSEMSDFFQAVCPGRNVVLEYMGLAQYTELLKTTHPSITKYTIRLRKLIALWRFFERYEEGKCNLILYNALSMNTHLNHFIDYVTNVFTNNLFRFNKAFVIKNTSLTSSIAMTKNEKKIIELMGTNAKLSCENILEYLERLKTRKFLQYIQPNPSTNSLQGVQSISAQSTLFSLPPIAFIFVDFKINCENSFPLPTILDIASRQKCGIFAQMVDENTSSFTIVENYDLGQIGMSFDFWKTFNDKGLYSLLDQQYCFFLIRNAHYNTFYSELQKKEEEEKKKKQKDREYKKIKNRQYRKKHKERKEEKEKEKQREIEKKEMSISEKEREARERNRMMTRDWSRRKREKEAEKKRRRMMGREMTESEKKEMEILRFPFIFSTLPKSLSDLLASTSQQNNYRIANIRLKRKYSNIKITDVIYYAKKGIIIMQSVSEIDTPADSQTPSKPILVDILILEDDAEEEPSLETERVADITSRYDRDTLACGYLSNPLLQNSHPGPCSDVSVHVNFDLDSHPNSYFQLNSDCNSERTSDLPPSLLNDIPNLEEDCDQKFTT
ncbi:hypothetical protein NEFER01_2170 [Nematocida sp. LUAm1]|nr:hypothetical protein NEFER02_2205 [Nematocida sp. LUAm2]KAI5179326.1 hypothetical protein NEFER01_2170 [Nematocida sp. LUAm1]